LPIAIDSEMVIANTIWEIPAIDIKDTSFSMARIDA
jgi:hypothetical protein